MSRLGYMKQIDSRLKDLAGLNPRREKLTKWWEQYGQSAEPIAHVDCAVLELANTFNVNMDDAELIAFSKQIEIICDYIQPLSESCRYSNGYALGDIVGRIQKIVNPTTYGDVEIRAGGKSIKVDGLAFIRLCEAAGIAYEKDYMSDMVSEDGVDPDDEDEYDTCPTNLGDRLAHFGKVVASGRYDDEYSSYRMKYGNPAGLEISDLTT